MESIVSGFMADPMGQADSEVGAVEWTKDLETGIDILDDQHHRYIELLNDYLSKASDKTTTPEQKATRLSESLNFLHQYAEEHFSTEESIMADTEFPDFEEHLEEHSFFLKHVEELCGDLEKNGFSPGLSREVNYYIVEWFIQHILLMDMQLVEFLKLRH